MRLPGTQELRSPLARRLVVAVVLFSSAITLALTAFQLYRNYRTDLSLIDNEFTQIERVHVPSITNALWATDLNAVQLQLDGMLRQRDMHYLEVREAGAIAVTTGAQTSGSILAREFPLVYAHRGQTLQIGTLKAVISLDGVYRRLLGTATVILVSNAIKTFLVAGFMLALFHWLVGQHLHQIGRYVRELGFDRLDEPIAIDRQDRPGRPPDEIDHLATALDEMRRNLSEQHRTAEALRERERAYATLLANLSGMVYRCRNDEAWTMELVSDGCRELTGYRADELVNNSVITFGDLVHLDDQQPLLEKCQANLAARRTCSNEYRIRAKDGTEKWVWDQAQGIYDDDMLLAFEGFISDISARKQAEAETMRLGRILDESANEIYIFRAADLRFVSVNAGALRNLSYSMDELRDMTPLDLKPKYTRETFEQLLAPLRRNERDLVSFETFHRRKDGNTYPVEVRLHLSHREEPAVFVAVILDISERKQAELERENLLTELTARNAEMENFVYTISHDLKAPLITIGGFAGLLQRDLARGNAANANDSLMEVRTAVMDMQKLIDDLLMLSRTGRVVGEPEPVALDALAAEVVDRLKERIETAHARVTLAPELPVIYADRARMAQVFQNLIDNALKYARDGIDPVIEIGSERCDGELRIFVRDNGRGIKQEYHERIFGLFQRADTQTESTGVGLTITRRIIEVHGGRIWVESESGRGSTFWISFPDSVSLGGGDPLRMEGKI